MFKGFSLDAILTPPKAGAIVLLALIAAPVLVELLLQGADFGLWGSARWRNLAYQFGGFWAGLLHNWTPNFTAQPVTMFLSYAFLHAGLNHLAGNMLGLWVLGRQIAAHYDARRSAASAASAQPLRAPSAAQSSGPSAGPSPGRGLLTLYTLSALGGAVMFGAFTHSPSPMVGASGAVFGLAGAWSVWDWQQGRAEQASRLQQWRAPLIALGLVVLNLVTWAMNGGALAWEAHLGGYLTGALLAARPNRFV